MNTRRLLLEPLALCDAAQVQPIFSHWEIVRYLAARVPWPFPPDGVRSYYEQVALPAIQRGEEWHWTIRTRDTPDRIIGAVTLHGELEANRGLWIATEHQGLGFATESLNAVTDFWFSVLHAPKLRVTKASANTASSRISQKQGMRLVGATESDYVCGRLPTEIWEITAAEWAARASLPK